MQRNIRNMFRQATYGETILVRTSITPSLPNREEEQNKTNLRFSFIADRRKIKSGVTSKYYILGSACYFSSLKRK